MELRDRGWKLTGRLRVRATWRHQLILQVEERERFHTHWWRWRDATLLDLQEVGSDEINVQLSKAMKVATR